MNATCVALGAASAVAPEVDPDYAAACPNNTCSNISTLCQDTTSGDKVIIVWQNDSDASTWLDETSVVFTRAYNATFCQWTTALDHIRLRVVNDTAFQISMINRNTGNQYYDAVHLTKLQVLANSTTNGRRSWFHNPFLHHSSNNNNPRIQHIHTANNLWNQGGGRSPEEKCLQPMTAGYFDCAIEWWVHMRL